jgi:hypothetical protein
MANELCVEMLQDVGGYWDQQMLGPCSQVTADAQAKAASLPGVPITVWSWDPIAQQWTQPIYYNQPIAAQPGSGPSAPTPPTSTASHSFVPILVFLGLAATAAGGWWYLGKSRKA